MKIKYRSGYAEGGFLDDGASVDPVSGNEVPSGSLAEEVRDDVPAQLSEGEFVVPADVVRYIGLEKLMKMRETAKVGLANMEADGQMGGQPAPMMEESMMDDPMIDDSMEMDALINGMDSEGFEGAVQEFSKGGSVRGYEEGGDVELPSYETFTGRKFNQPDLVEYVEYINADGDIITIPTLRGKPLKAIPEGYSLYLAPDEDEKPDPDDPREEEGNTGSASKQSNNNSAAQDFARNGGNEKRESDKIKSQFIQTKRVSDITSLAGADLSQAGVDQMYSTLTPQAQQIYDDRFRDTKFLDDFLSEGKSTADLMITAQKTADSLNRQRGVIEYEDTSTYNRNANLIDDLVQGAKLFTLGITLGPTGLMGKALKGMTDEEKERIKSTLEKVKGYFDPSPFGNKDKGRGNQPTVKAKANPYNQAYWRGQLEAGLSQADIAAEKRTIAAEWGTDAYGRKLTKGELDAAARMGGLDADERARAAAKLQRTMEAAEDEEIAKKKAEAEAEMKRAILEAEEAQKKKEAEEAAAVAAQEQKDSDARDLQEARDAVVENEARLARELKARDEAAAAALADQQRRQQSQTTVNSGGDGRGERQRDAKGNATKGGAVTSGTTGKNTTGKSFNYGGLVSPSKPKIKKMRNDPTSGLASKKKAKQKAQAKKGALAAKRT